MSLSRKAAFTLLELLMVLALIGLLGTLTVSYSVSLLAGVGDEPLQETLRRAVREARFQAASTGTAVYLTWDAERAAFNLTSEDGTQVGTFKADADPKLDKVTFLQLLPLRGIDVPTDEPNTQEVKTLFFAPDRSSTPFLAEVSWAGESKTLRYDPFSNLTLEDAER